MTRMDMFDSPPPDEPIRWWPSYLLLAVVAAITVVAMVLLSEPAPVETPVPTNPVSTDSPSLTVVPGGVR